MENRSLYLRWRPRRFSDVIAQDPVTQTLRNAVVRGTTTHAYLLCGPRGTGKTSIARILYRAINCLAPEDGEPCGICASCVAVDEGRAVDLIEMDAASHGGIDDVRDLRERVYFAPVDAKSKVYIVDEAHQLTARAWDAFLKTLEEPPPKTVFVLATTEAHRVPATIVSRCQRFDLRRIPQGRLAEHLETVARGERISLEAGVAERLARLARGSMRDGESMLEQVAAFGGEIVTMEGARNVLGLVRGDALRSYMDALSTGDGGRALQLVEDVVEQGADLRQFLDEVLLYLRGTLLARSGASAALELTFGQDERIWLTDIAERWAPGQILGLLRAFGEIESRGRDEHHVLVRTELVTAWAVSLMDRTIAAEQMLVAEGAALPVAPRAAAPAAAAPAVVLEVGGGEAPGRAPSPSPSSPTGEKGKVQPAAPSEAPPAAAPGRIPTQPSAAPHVTAIKGEEGPASPPKAAPATAPAARPSAAVPSVHVSVAALQAEWSGTVDKLSQSLLIKMRLRDMQPVALDDALVTIGGPVDLLDLQRLDTPDVRAAIEALLSETFGAPLRVRLKQTEAAVAPEASRAANEPPTAAGPQATVPDAGSLAEMGSNLFGGRLVSDS